MLVSLLWFEKSLYDLIKGLRSHRTAEDDYIQSSLRECRAEVKSQDMDKKATALLKLVYLEMFGYDMSWASFHVLEVMSSSKYLLKRAGYLGAVQSFRTDTEILMLATNLLKKDLASPGVPNISLPLITLPNIITPSLAMSLVSDVLSRISHTHAVVRKKAIVCLYRLALVYPEALNVAWPKIKDRLMDEDEDNSVTTAAINVVCELGWRRPHDLLPLAPRLFDLLVDGGNNWMAIKVIKLFATLTPLEPRLVRKLLRPLTNIIRTTSAMSLLYECINGIIQGGILDGDGAVDETTEIASLCVGKLRGMIVTDSDPNLKYVALLSFNRIAGSYPRLVSMHQDVILGCLEDADVSIRLQALDLVSQVVTSETLVPFVNQLINQLDDEHQVFSDEYEADEGDMCTESGMSPKQYSVLHTGSSFLPKDYSIEVLHRILDICSYKNYSNLLDFEWYVGVLLRLVKLVPTSSRGNSCFPSWQGRNQGNIGHRIVSEIRNVSVRVKEVRSEATTAAECLILTKEDTVFPGVTATGADVLGPLAWVVGEFAQHLRSPRETLLSLMEIANTPNSAHAVPLSIQAILKIFVRTILAEDVPWDTQGRGEATILLTRITRFLEALTVHPDLDVQERAIEFLEVTRLAVDSIQSESHAADEIPFLLSSIIPGMFRGLELNPVAASAQRKVPLPDNLSLDEAFKKDLPGLFSSRHSRPKKPRIQSFTEDFYYLQGTPTSVEQSSPGDFGYEICSSPSYQNHTMRDIDGVAALTLKKAERREQYRDDPFYIDSENGAGNLNSIGPDVHGVDLDSIPIVNLGLEETGNYHKTPAGRSNPKAPRRKTKKYDIMSDEMIGQDDPTDLEDFNQTRKARSSLLQVDSSGLGQLPLGNDRRFSPSSHDPTRIGDDAEMAKAMQEVERMRLQMQRASERVHLEGFPAEGTLVKKKRGG
ncbi:AP-3 complex subunit delta [Aspergillus campestris IBT 28561]|uniref:AP-3 complex subunit delta n=1 Tax=Aspergillus campestris (strain IBT 28561) TaxID=1392248 RepID=A0A2I1CUN7_ASPC2|nr:AP-3 complex subunit delta [Aspergillus campestris IBT 28561]PKY01329.1 AP-3 complex subunit delta [Aspergillus campestris IBT 28561]